MNIGLAEITIASLVISEVVLTYRIWKLERRLMQTMNHFIEAKQFLGGIEEHVKTAAPIISQITLNGAQVEMQTEKFGKVSLTIKPSTAPRHIPEHLVKQKVRS